MLHATPARAQDGDGDAPSQAVSVPLSVEKGGCWTAGPGFWAVLAF